MSFVDLVRQTKAKVAMLAVLPHTFVPTPDKKPN